MCIRGTWLVLVRASALEVQGVTPRDNAISHQYRAESRLPFASPQCQVLLEHLLASVDVRKMRSLVYDMWFLGQDPLASYFDAFDDLGHRWVKESGFKVIIAPLKKSTVFVRQGRIFNYMTRR